MDSSNYPRVSSLGGIEEEMTKTELVAAISIPVIVAVAIIWSTTLSKALGPGYIWSSYVSAI